MEQMEGENFTPKACPVWTTDALNKTCGDVPEKHFDTVLMVWIKKPHTVNRRLIGAKIVQEAEVTTSKDPFKVLWEEIASFRKEQSIEELFEKLNGVLTSPEESVETDKVKSEAEMEIEAEKSEEHSVHLYVRDLIPKQLDRFHTLRELVVKRELNPDLVNFTYFCVR